MNLCSENGIYLGTRGAAAALQCFLVPLKSPELPKPSSAAAQRILITNGPKLCCSLSDCGSKEKELPCNPPYLHHLLLPCYLLQLSICISHLQSPHCLFILSLCPIQSQPVFGSLCLFHCLIWRARLFFAAQPWSLGAWGAAVGDTGLTLPTLTASN